MKFCWTSTWRFRKSVGSNSACNVAAAMASARTRSMVGGVKSWTQTPKVVPPAGLVALGHWNALNATDNTKDCELKASMETCTRKLHADVRCKFQGIINFKRFKSQSFSQGRADETALPTYSCNSIDTRKQYQQELLSCHVTGLDSYDNDSDRNLTSDLNDTTQKRPASCNCDSETRLHWQHHPPPSSRCHTEWPPGWYRCQRCPNSCFAIASSRSLSYLGIRHWFSWFVGSTREQ